MAFPTDYRGKTMVQPDGSYKNTPIPKRLRRGTSTKVSSGSGTVRDGGNYKRHWSQKKTARKK